MATALWPERCGQVVLTSIACWFGCSCTGLDVKIWCADQRTVVVEVPSRWASRIHGPEPEHHFIASTVAEDIAWGLVQRGVSSEVANRKLFDMAKALRIDHLMDRPCAKLWRATPRRSGGTACASNPLYFCWMNRLLGLIQSRLIVCKSWLRHSPVTRVFACVWATHDLQSTPSLAKRVVLLHGAIPNF